MDEGVHIYMHTNSLSFTHTHAHTHTHTHTHMYTTTCRCLCSIPFQRRKCNRERPTLEGSSVQLDGNGARNIFLGDDGLEDIPLLVHITSRIQDVLVDCGAK